MNFLKIDGKAYDVVVVGISENFNILYSENTGRSISLGARMVLDPLGTFIGHKVKVKRRNGKEAEFDALWDYLCRPRFNGVKIEAVHNQTTIEYDAYISNGERALERISKSDIVYWGEFEFNIVPMEAQVLPE